MSELTISRTLAARPERVWRALMDPAELAAWFWPTAWNTVVVADVRPGGRYRVSSAPKGMAFEGVYVAVEPLTRLVQTWQWDGEAEETIVTITLEAIPDGTRLTIVHERFTTGDDRDNHRQGWNDCLDRLPLMLTEQP